VKSEGEFLLHGLNQLLKGDLEARIAKIIPPKDLGRAMGGEGVGLNPRQEVKAGDLENLLKEAEEEKELAIILLEVVPLGHEGQEPLLVQFPKLRRGDEDHADELLHAGGQ